MQYPVRLRDELEFGCKGNIVYCEAHYGWNNAGAWQISHVSKLRRL